MRALEFWKAVTEDQANVLERVIALLTEHRISFCVIGGHAVNAYVEPVVSLDLDLVVALDHLAEVESLFSRMGTVQRDAHSVNLSVPGSDLRVQIRRDPRYGSFVERASPREVLGLVLPVAHIEDVLRSKVWAVQDAERRSSKRQKDLADLARMLEAYPELRSLVPQEVLKHLV